jgi:L-alanine-DL-glutamate epimerase-like enolase superfamily enzyme
MRIVEIREASVPLEANIQNSVVSFADHTVSLVAVVSDVIRDGKPVTGVAFDSIGRYAQSGLLRERFIPRLLKAKPDDPRCVRCGDRRRQGVPGDDANEAGRPRRPGASSPRSGGVWDLNAKLAGVPAWKLIADSHGVAARERMPVYAAGGYYYPEDSLGRLKDEMKAYGDMGYTSFKMKIGGAPLAEDMKRIEAALSVVGDPNVLAVDANGRFDTPTAVAYGKAMADFGLRWYEEPGDPLDYQLMADLAETYQRPLATGENLFSLRDVDNLIRHGGMRKGHDLFQMDPALGYGLGEFARMIGAMEKAGYSRAQLFPHGGHNIALHVVVGLGLGGSEAYPGVFAPVGGYAPDCTLENGGIAPGQRPGFGLEAKPDLAPHIARLVA